MTGGGAVVKIAICARLHKRLVCFPSGGPVAARTGVQARALEAYAAATASADATYPTCGLGWVTLAGIGYVESHNGEMGDGLEPSGRPRVPILGIDLDAGAEEFRLLALGEMSIGPDIAAAKDGDDTTDPLLSIGAIGVLILNGDGIAGDFTVNLSIGGPIAAIIEVDVYARVIFNTAGKDMSLRLSDDLVDYLYKMATERPDLIEALKASVAAAKASSARPKKAAAKPKAASAKRPARKAARK